MLAEHDGATEEEEDGSKNGEGRDRARQACMGGSVACEALGVAVAEEMDGLATVGGVHGSDGVQG